MFTSETASKAAQRRNTQQGQSSLDGYLRHPNQCTYCHQDILPKPGQRACDVWHKKFCNQACAASFNNAQRKKIKLCQRCNATQVTGRQKYCKECRYSNRNRDTPSIMVDTITKGEIFARYPHYTAARNILQKHASRRFKKHRRLVCEHCGYSHYAEVCHIKPVSAFGNTATLGEINSLDNLIALCPNHHWEYDHGVLIV